MVFSVIWSVFGWYQFPWIYWKLTIYRNFTWISAKWSIFRWSQRGPYIRNRVYLFLRANEINCKKERARSVTKVHNSRTLPCPSSSVSGWPWWPRWTPHSALPASWPSTPSANTHVLIQGDTEGCSPGFVDIKEKVEFQYKHILKLNLCFDVN